MGSKPVYIVSGEALDQETVIRLKPKIEDFVENTLCKQFSRSTTLWNLNSKGHFDFKIKFWR
jgi:hypothetical protein